MNFTYIGNQKNKDVRLASSFANGAFLTANSAADFANGAFDRANAAYNAANTGGSSTDSWARAQANAAFNAANNITVTGGSLTGYVDSFTANGTGNTFTLSTTPTNANITFVAVQGVLQPKSAYSLSGNVVVFDTPPPNTSFIEVTTLSGGGGSGDSWVANTANLAYAQANAAFSAANNATDTWVRNQANNAYDTANAAGSFANGAFVTANSGASFANGAFLRANAS